LFNTSLLQAVEQFADTTRGVPDADLDREWAWGAYDSEGVRFALFRTYEELRELAANIATERPALGLAPSTAQRILAQYHAAYRDLQVVLLGIADAEANLAPAVGEWPVQQIVAHVVGAELGFYGAIKYALDRHRSGDERSAEIPAEAWEPMIGMDEAAYEAMMSSPLTDLQSRHSTFHDRILETFSNIGDAELALPSVYWEGYELSLRFRLHRFDSHLRQHTIQAEKTLSLIGYPFNEAKGLLRLIFAALAEAEGATIGARETGSELCQDAADAISARAEEIAGILAQ
jgi:hypothetical protein